MLFPTFEFFFFFIFVFLLYWYVFTKAQDRKVLLSIASLFFYSFSSVKFAILMVVLIIVTQLCCIALTRIKNYWPRKAFFVLATAVHLLFLLYFKEAYHLLGWIDSNLPNLFEQKLLKWLLENTAIAPLGVSYYVFKCCSYLFDVYLGKLSCRKSFIDVVLYVSFFPQIFSGPIVNATYFFEKLEKSLTADANTYNFLDFDRASLLILLGFIKKAIIATFLSILVVNPVFANPQSYHAVELVFASIAWSVVIYADFSGYSDMAVGIALLLGFETPANFRRPYSAKSVTDFWRRWHISFSRFLQEYVYRVLGGSRFGIFRTLISLIFTMLIAGLWHGGKLTFVVWGLLQGAALCVERFISYLHERAGTPFESMVFGSSNEYNALVNDKTTTKEALELDSCLLSSEASIGSSEFSTTIPKKPKPLAKPSTKMLKSVFSRFVTFVFVTISWIFFRSESLDEAFNFFGSIFVGQSGFKGVNLFCVLLVIVSIGFQYIPEDRAEKMLKVYKKVPFLLKLSFVASVFLLSQMLTTSGISEFIYFQF